MAQQQEEEDRVIDKKMMRRMRNKWLQMISRCRNPNSDNYRWYGARGIDVCGRWRNSFDAFLKDVGIPPDGHELDRIDTDGNYEPGNVRWVTHAENMRNRRPFDNERKLDADDVRTIDFQLSMGRTQKNIAADFNVTRQHISRIATGRDWGSVTGRMYRPRVVS